MNDCPDGEIRDRLPDLLHGRLSDADRAMVEAHLATCEDCRAELALLTELRGALGRAPAVDVASIVRALPAWESPARRPRVTWRAAAAIAAIVVGGSAVAVARHEPSARVATVEVGQRPAVTAPIALPPVVAPVPAGPAAAERVAQAPARRELPVSGAVSDLSDGELAALLGQLESLDAVPAASADVESTSLAPAASARSQGES